MKKFIFFMLIIAHLITPHTLFSSQTETTEEHEEIVFDDELITRGNIVSRTTNLQTSAIIDAIKDFEIDEEVLEDLVLDDLFDDVDKELLETPENNDTSTNTPEEQVGFWRALKLFLGTPL